MQKKMLNYASSSKNTTENGMKLLSICQEEIRRRLQPIKIVIIFEYICRLKQWTQEEDEIIVKKHGKNWKMIASRKNQYNYSSLDFSNNFEQTNQRTVYKQKQVINTGPWTEEEDATLFKLYQEYGGKWSLISSYFKGRPVSLSLNIQENMVRNRIYCYIVVQSNYSILIRKSKFSKNTTILEEFILASQVPTRLFIKRINESENEDYNEYIKFE
ncbi:unnamed protein product (macronuclear) [Paramecium tetraurelia]|uniref:Myb-like domain-containing protein n=1 Tax=Paramecium tetraurelia TaxID=5888 RepID=A0CUG5_PARTE|nr:uncharacterized protein GSPATT00010632001 [Paramecium tetraurelia]CAK74432.1 unnamed protein product [Paramecium tetraurelia]|eukprot:XP_001441829.1 hypothetical protein (macronuclear) [Paramecium tetraurelia strain d4-2]